VKFKIMYILKYGISGLKRIIFEDELFDLAVGEQCYYEKRI